MEKTNKKEVVTIYYGHTKHFNFNYADKAVQTGRVKVAHIIKEYLPHFFAAAAIEYEGAVFFFPGNKGSIHERPGAHLNDHQYDYCDFECFCDYDSGDFWDI